MEILCNKIHCNQCNTVIESYYTHDYKKCECGKCRVDGGHSYLRRIGSGFTDMSVHDNGDHLTRRLNLRWGRNTNKQGELLNQTEWIRIQDLSTSHIENILKNVSNINSLYREVFENELKFRKNGFKNL